MDPFGDVDRLLASVGSPLVEERTDVAKQKLPASAVAELLEARLGALAPPGKTVEPLPEVSTPQDEVRFLAHI